VLSTCRAPKAAVTYTPLCGSNITTLTKELWQAAVNLRGSIEPADYKRYVLPLIFLRFLSLRYERAGRAGGADPRPGQRVLCRHGRAGRSDEYRMNLFIHGIRGEIGLGNSYNDDKHADQRADYILASPPFNDGAKGRTAGARTRFLIRTRAWRSAASSCLYRRATPTRCGSCTFFTTCARGRRRFLMATGELSNSETARQQVRQALVEHNYGDCIVQLTGQLFANTQIPCALWFRTKSRDGGQASARAGARSCSLTAASSVRSSQVRASRRKLTAEEIERVAAVYRQFRPFGVPDEVRGSAEWRRSRRCGAQICADAWAVCGVAGWSEDEEEFEEKMPRWSPH